MKVLVTGGAGFIGSHVVDAYVRLGNAVTVVDDLSSGRKEFVNRKAKLYQFDITNQEKIKQLIQTEKPDIINHHAAQISVKISVEKPWLDAKINLLGLINILEAARDAGVKKIIFASSGGAIYGDAKIVPTSEDFHPLNPLSPYGISKLASECYLHYYYKNYKIPYIALRYSNVYGPRQNPLGEAGVVAIFSLKIINGITPVINGDGKQTRDYICVTDVVKANLAALDTESIGSYNIGTGMETNVIEIYQKLKRNLKGNISARHGPSRLGEQQRSCLDIHLAKEKLGWDPVISIDQGLEQTAAYFKQYEKKES